MLSPSFITQGRMEARQTALILMKNSHFDRTPRYTHTTSSPRRKADAGQNMKKAYPHSMPSTSLTVFPLLYSSYPLFSCLVLLLDIFYTALLVQPPPPLPLPPVKHTSIAFRVQFFKASQTYNTQFPKSWKCLF